MNPESLIFDVDGTLWDSVDLVVRGWNLALEEAGREPTCTPEGIRPLFGKTMDEIALAFLPDQGQEERRRLMNSCMAWEDRVMQDDPCEFSILRSGRPWSALPLPSAVYRQQLPEGLH